MVVTRAECQRNSANVQDFCIMYDQGPGKGFRAIFEVRSCSPELGQALGAVSRPGAGNTAAYLNQVEKALAGYVSENALPTILPSEEHRRRVTCALADGKTLSHALSTTELSAAELRTQINQLGLPAEAAISCLSFLGDSAFGLLQDRLAQSDIDTFLLSRLQRCKLVELAKGDTTSVEEIRVWRNKIFRDQLKEALPPTVSVSIESAEERLKRREEELARQARELFDPANVKITEADRRTWKTTGCSDLGRDVFDLAFQLFVVGRTVGDVSKQLSIPVIEALSVRSGMAASITRTRHQIGEEILPRLLPDLDPRTATWARLRLVYGLTLDELGKLSVVDSGGLSSDSTPVTKERVRQLLAKKVYRHLPEVRGKSWNLPSEKQVYDPEMRVTLKVRRVEAALRDLHALDCSAGEVGAITRLIRTRVGYARPVEQIVRRLRQTNLIGPEGAINSHYSLKWVGERRNNDEQAWNVECNKLINAVTAVANHPFAQMIGASKTRQLVFTLTNRGDASFPDALSRFTAVLYRDVSNVYEKRPKDQVIVQRGLRKLLLSWIIQRAGDDDYSLSKETSAIKASRKRITKYFSETVGDRADWLRLSIVREFLAYPQTPAQVKEKAAGIKARIEFRLAVYDAAVQETGGNPALARAIARAIPLAAMRGKNADQRQEKFIQEAVFRYGKLVEYGVEAGYPQQVVVPAIALQCFVVRTMDWKRTFQSRANSIATMFFRRLSSDTQATSAALIESEVGSKGDPHGALSRLQAVLSADPCINLSLLQDSGKRSDLEDRMRRWAVNLMPLVNAGEVLPQHLIGIIANAAICFRSSRGWREKGSDPALHSEER